LAGDHDEASLVAEAGLAAIRQPLMPLPATLPDFVFQQTLSDLQAHLDGKRREGLPRELHERFDVQRQLNFPGLGQGLLLDPTRPTATLDTAKTRRGQAGR
jgi:hypothetical protein